MIRHGAIALTLLAGGCGDLGFIRIALLTQEQGGEIVEGSRHEDLVRDATAILGYEALFVERRRGALALELIPIDPDRPFVFTGRALVMEGCYRGTWAQPISAQIVAHEIAHALGLEHRDEAGNLMSRVADPDSTDLTWQQEAVISFNVEELGRC